LLEPGRWQADADHRVVADAAFFHGFVLTQKRRSTALPAKGAARDAGPKVGPCKASRRTRRSFLHD
jgi:hypothetical protein